MLSLFPLCKINQAGARSSSTCLSPLLLAASHRNLDDCRGRAIVLHLHLHPCAALDGLRAAEIAHFSSWGDGKAVALGANREVDHIVGADCRSCHTLEGDCVQVIRRAIGLADLRSSVAAI